jgi:hypothetical protein
VGGRAPLDAALERALLVQLGQTWAEINHNHFRARLRRPVFLLSDTTRRLGAWDSGTRTLSISRRLILDCAWTVVREVLKHEIAHQFVDEALGVRDQVAHGPAFEAVCRQHGFDATATGIPHADAAGAPGAPPEQTDRGSPVLRRIARLLALADSPNQHEAAAAMKAAQRLMLLHNIDAAAASAREGFTYRHVGTPSGRVSGAEHVLAGLLARHFFVDVIWVPSYLPRTGRAGRVLELCGTPSNLDVAAYVHGFLMETAERLWRDHRSARGLAGNGERRRFILGVMIGFDEKLKTAADDSRREGLIWVGDPALTDYLGRRYPRRTGGAGIGIPNAESTEQGRRAGRTIILHRPITNAPPENRGRLLSGAS